MKRKIDDADLRTYKKVKEMIEGKCDSCYNYRDKPKIVKVDCAGNSLGEPSIWNLWHRFSGGTYVWERNANKVYERST